jgi:hypothetical protein
VDLRIITTPALIGIDTRPAKIEIDSQLPKVEMKQQKAQLDIDTELPRVYIDQYECFAQLGYKNSLDVAWEQAQKAYERVMGYIAETAREGDRLAAIELGGNPVVDIAEEKSYWQPAPEPFMLPLPRPRFKVVGGISIQYQPGKIHFNAIIHPVRFNVTPHKVEIYMRQYPDISIEYTGNSIDRRV